MARGDNPEIDALVEEAKEKIAHYWKSNIHRYFSKTDSNYMGFRGVGSISFSYKSRGKLINAVRVNFNKSLDEFDIDMADETLINPMSGENYRWTITEGTNTSNGRFIASKHVRVKEGLRMGTTDAAWEAFRHDLITFSDAILEEYRVKANGVLRKQKRKVPDYSLPEEIG